MEIESREETDVGEQIQSICLCIERIIGGGHSEI